MGVLKLFLLWLFYGCCIFIVYNIGFGTDERYAIGMAMLFIITMGILLVTINVIIWYIGYFYSYGPNSFRSDTPDYFENNDKKNHKNN